MNTGNQSMASQAIKINCFECVHFQITHDKRRPYGCNSMGFKSKVLPSLEVISVQGHSCLAFTAKDRPARKNQQAVNLHL